MGTEVEKFDPSTLMQGVKDRIKATFVSLIPDAKWEEMVEAEITAFFNEKHEITVAEKRKQDGSFHGTTYQTMTIHQSPFRALVWEHCAELTVKYLKEKIDKDYFAGKWGVTEADLDEKMKGFISEAAPAAMAKFFERLVYNATQDLRNSVMGGGM